MKRFLQFIRFSHTVFALPFAIGAWVVASNGSFSWRLFALVVLCMVFARSAAMIFNRLADWEIDKRNPRTEGRHKLVSKRQAVGGLVIFSGLFVATTGWINPLCFWLSPVALVIVFFYSLTKRFTSFAQFFLGLALAVSPVGAWLAVTGEFAWAPLILALGVLFWVSGFDLIYATQDYEIDRREGLKSMVLKLGISKALVLARVLHSLAWVCLAGFGWVAGLGLPFWVGIVVIAGVLVWEHGVARKGDLSAINLAFFQANAVVGGVFLGSIVLAVLL